jgi:hypothetical protein
MEWTVNIENKKNQRILVRFDPLNDLLHFIGQYKPHLYSKEWVDFSQLSKPLWSLEITAISNTANATNFVEGGKVLITAETIQDALFDAYKEMEKRLEAYKNINEGFTLIKLIEIKEE